MKKKERKPELESAVAGPQPATSVPWWLWPAALVAGFLAYQPALKGPFLFDDLALPPMNESARRAFADYWSGFRPLYYTALQFDTTFFGPDSFVFHLINLLYHFANAALVFLILRRLLNWAKPELVRAEWLAFAGAMLFLLHPLQTESVAYIASRSEVMSVFFAWSALVLYLWDREAMPGAARALAVFALLFLGLASKEHIAAVPAVLLLVDYFFRPGFSFEGVRRRWIIYVPFALGAIGAVLFVLRRSGETTVGAGTGMTPMQYLLTQCKVVWIYLRLFLLPMGQNIDWAYPAVKNLSDPLALAGAAAILASLILAWRYRKQWPLASLGWFVFLALLAPTSSFVPIADTLAERRLYLPFLGLLLMLMEALSRVRFSGASVAGVCAALLACAALTYQRSHVFTGALALWGDSVEKNPANGRAWFQYAFAQYESNQCLAAVKSFERTASLQKPDYRLLVDWSLAYDCANLPTQAIEKLTEALQLENNYHGWATLGMLHGKQGRAQQALQALDRAIQAKSDYEIAWFYRGNVYMTQQRFADAVSAYEAALKINPNHRPSQEALVRARTALAAPEGH